MLNQTKHKARLGALHAPAFQVGDNVGGRQRGRHLGRGSAFKDSSQVVTNLQQGGSGQETGRPETKEKANTETNLQPRAVTLGLKHLKTFW